MDMVEIDVDTRCTILQYLNLISKRASGTVQLTLEQGTLSSVSTASTQEDRKSYLHDCGAHWLSW